MDAAIQRVTHRLPLAGECLRETFTKTLWPANAVAYCHHSQKPSFRSGHLQRRFTFGSKPNCTVFCNRAPNRGSYVISAAGWFSGLGAKKEVLPDIVKAGDPVLHEPAQEVSAQEIGSERIQKIIDDMIKVMRKAPGVGLAAPQIGIPLKIIVLEDTKEYISYAAKDEIKAQDRRPFDLLVIINPKLTKKGKKTAFFFEGCLSVDGFRAVVERNLEVEVRGMNRDGKPIKVDASGWQARILQHECDHLQGNFHAAAGNQSHSEEIWKMVHTNKNTVRVTSQQSSRFHPRF